MLKPNVYFLFFTLILILAVQAVHYLLPSNNLFVPKFWVIFTFVAGITLLAFNASYIASKKNSSHSTFIILAANVIKLLFCMALVVVYLQIYSVKPVLFIVNFFLVYLLFTAFEIYTLLLNLRHPNKKLKTSN